MGSQRRSSRSKSPGGKAKKKAKRPSSSSPPPKKGSDENANPFWAIYGTGTERNDHSEVKEDAMDVDVDAAVNDKHKHDHKHDHDHDAADRIFDEMLVFAELSSSAAAAAAKTKKHGAGESEFEFDEQRDTTTTTTETTTKTPGFVTANDVAGLLLPWAVRGILRAAQQKPKANTDTNANANANAGILYWKTLDACLARCFDRPGTGTGDDSLAMLTQTLTLSTLHKIVPIALALALKDDGCGEEATGTEGMDTVAESNFNTDDSLSGLATSCYCQLADQLYRPPFDVVCDSLLPILATSEASTTTNTIKATTSTTKTSRWLEVAASTIRLMGSRIVSANPKKSFQLLVKPTVFLDLARIYHFAQQQSFDDRVRTLNDLAEALVRNGLFGLEHHMDGFRSLQLAIPLVDVGGQSKKRDDNTPQKTKTKTAANAKAAAKATATAKSFRGYQEGLFDTLEGFLESTNADAGGTSAASVDTVAVVSSLCPLLLDVFLKQSSTLQEKQQQAASRPHKKSSSSSSSSSSSKAANKMGLLQFRFFARLSGYLLKSLMATTSKTTTPSEDTTSGGSLFAVLGRNLELLLKHNIYQPSLGNHAERSFLDAIGKETIRQLSARDGTNNNNNNNNKLSLPEWNHGLVVLEVLMRLNHTLLHDQLADILAGCLAYKASPDPASDSASTSVSAETASTALFATIIGTYGKLRQLDYFYRSLFRAVSVLSDQNDTDRLGGLSALLDRNEVLLCIGRAIEESPIQQLKHVFSDTNNNNTFAPAAGGSGSGRRKVALVASGVSTKALVGLLKDVRVDSNSSNELYPICNDILRGSVAGLIGSGSESDDECGYLTNAVVLCAWTIHLKNRCEFWVGNNHNHNDKPTESSGDDNISGIPPVIRRLLDDAIRGKTEQHQHRDRDRDGDRSEALRFLACQRIQQLHGECYEKQRLAYASDAEKYSTAQESAEARELVGFILRGCATTPSVDNNPTATPSISGDDQWMVLAESISIWAPYANRDDIDSFLNQLLRAMAIVDHQSHGNDIQQQQQQQRQRMVSILNDTSFYEVPNVSERIGANVVSFVASNVQKIATLCAGSTPRHAAMACPILHKEWKRLSSFREIANLQDDSSNSGGMTMPRNPNRIAEIHELFRGCLRVLETFEDGSTVPVWEHCGDDDDASNVLESMVRIESVCHAVHVGGSGGGSGEPSSSSLFDTKARLVSALRVAASRIWNAISIPTHSEDNDKTTRESTRNEHCTMQLRWTLENSLQLLDDDGLSSGTRQWFISSGNVLAEALVRQCTNGRSNPKSAIELVEVLDSTFDQGEVATGGTKYLVLMNYAMTLLKEFHGTSSRMDTDTDTDTDATKRFLRVVKKRLWATAQNYCFDDPPKDTDYFLRKQSTVFVAELLRLSSICSDTDDAIPLGSLGYKIAGKLSDSLARADSGHPAELASISYLVGCFAMTQPPRNIREKLRSELLLANSKGHSTTFLTPLCALARSMEITEFDEFLGLMVADAPATATKLQLLRAVILSVTTTGQQSHVDVVAKYSSRILNNCLQVMTTVARKMDNQPDSITEASSLIIEMGSNKDIMGLRERHIALILARITSAITMEEEDGKNGAKTTNNDIADVQIKAYEAAFSLASFFLQRFSKQVHSCVPSLIISLAAMLQFALRKSLPEQHMSLCGQRFSRLCELLLPHGDVYKKHVMCLILRFVTALQGDMNPVCRKSLLPGIYCLLDIIQQHESMQLNSMLDEECRAILRSIHEGYKKIHVYKGQ
eukprot:jgi/Psemu1/68346/estExt_Genemark1.C_4820020